MGSLGGADPAAVILNDGILPTQWRVGGARRRAARAQPARRSAPPRLRRCPRREYRARTGSGATAGLRRQYRAAALDRVRLLDAALAQFRILDMPGWIRRAEALHASSGGAAVEVPAAVALKVPGSDDDALRASRGRVHAASLRCEGDYWTVAYGDVVARVQDLKGLHYLARLLRAPGQEFHVLDLIGQGPGSEGTGKRDRPADGPLPLLDAEAKAAYRRRLGDLRAELAEAERCHDLGREEQARDEIEVLTQQLAGAMGLGGRGRRAGVGGGAGTLHGEAAAARRLAADRGAAPRAGRPSRGARADGDVLRVPARPGAAGRVGPRAERAPVSGEPPRGRAAAPGSSGQVKRSSRCPRTTLGALGLRGAEAGISATDRLLRRWPTVGSCWTTASTSSEGPPPSARRARTGRPTHGIRSDAKSPRGTALGLRHAESGCSSTMRF